MPDLHPTIQALTVYREESDGGAFILDPTGGPKWKLVNTRNATIQYFPKDTHRVTVLKKRDVKTNCAFLKIEFKTGRSPMKDGATENVGCFLANKLIRDMMVVHHGSERLKYSQRRKGEGKKGVRGRRGRGRGRRGSKMRGDPRMGFDTF